MTRLHPGLPFNEVHKLMKEECPTHIEIAADDAHRLFDTTVEQLRYLLGHVLDPLTGELPKKTDKEILSLVDKHSELFYPLLQSMTISAAAHMVSVEIDRLRYELTIEVKRVADEVGRID